MRIPLVNLIAGLGALLAVRGCYYSAMGMENMYDFWYRWCADGCRDIPISDSNYAACCSPLLSGASTPSVCISLSTECAAAGTTCAWSSAVPTSNFPTSAYTYDTSYTYVAPSVTASIPYQTSQTAPTTGMGGGETTTVTVTSTTTTPCAISASAMPTSTSNASCVCESGMAAGSTVLYSAAGCTTSGCPDQGAGRPSDWTGDSRKRSGNECVCPPVSSTYTEVVYSSVTTTTTSTIASTSTSCASSDTVVYPSSTAAPVISTTSAVAEWTSSTTQPISSGMAALSTSLAVIASSNWAAPVSSVIAITSSVAWVTSSTASDDGVLYRSYSACTTSSCPFQGAGRPSSWAGDYVSEQVQQKRAGRPSDWTGDYTSQPPARRALPSDYIPLEYNHRNASHKRDYLNKGRDLSPSFPEPTPFKLIKKDYVTTTITSWVTTDDCSGKAATPTSTMSDEDDCDDEMTSGMAAGSTVIPSSTALYEPWASGNGMEGAGRPFDWSGSDYTSSVVARRGWMEERQRGL